jgi:hypothetical protein
VPPVGDWTQKRLTFCLLNGLLNYSPQGDI